MNRADDPGYAIICDSRKGAAYGIKILAMVNRELDPFSWWTSDCVGLMMRFTHHEAALRAASRLRYNNARVVPFCEAFEIIMRQSFSALEAMRESDYDTDNAEHFDQDIRVF